MIFYACWGILVGLVFPCWVGLSGLNITLFRLYVESLTGGFLPLVMWLTSSLLVERKLALLGVRLVSSGSSSFFDEGFRRFRITKKTPRPIECGWFPCKKQPLSEHYLHADVEVEVRGVV